MNEIPGDLEDRETVEDLEDLEDDDEIIRTIRDRVETAAETLSGLPSLLRELGVRLCMRFSESFDLHDLEEAIKAIEKAVRLTPLEDVTNRSALLFDLGNAFDMKFSETDDIGDLEESIRAMRGCVDASPTNTLDRELRLISLASRLRTKFHKTGAMADVEEAVMFTRLLIVGISEPKSRARNLGNLGHLHVLGYEKSGDIGHLDEAIQAFQQVVDLTPQDHPSRGRRVRDLGLRREMKYSRTGDITDLDTAIRLLQESIRLTPGTDPTRAEWLHSFGVHLGHRYMRVGALADLEEGIRALGEGLDITANIHNRNQERPGLLYHLGVLLLLRHERAKKATDLTNAIRALQDASNSPAISRADRNRRTHSMGSLSTGLFTRYKSTRALADLEVAIRVARECIHTTQKDNLRDHSQSSNLCIAINNLGLMLEERFLRLGNMADLEEAISAQRECLSVALEDHPQIAAWRLHLGLGLERRYQATKSMPDLAEAISLCVGALNQANSYPRTRIKAGRHAVRLCAFTLDWQAAYSAASSAIDLIPAMVLQSLENSDKQHLIGQNSGLASDAAAVALNAGVPPHTCLRLLEQGRSIVAESLQKLRTDSLSLRGKHPELDERYASLRRELDLPDFPELDAESLTWEARTSRRYAASRDLELLLVEIREQPGFEDFLLPPTEKEMRDAASRGPVAVINVSRYRCDAFLVETHQIRCLRLPDLRSSDVERRVRDQSMGSPLTLQWLWDAVASPVMDALGFTGSGLCDDATARNWPHVWWIPTGPLRRYPIHAAGQYATNGPLANSVLERVMSSYGVSIKSMIHSQRHHQTAVADLPPPTSPEKMLLVAMRDTPGQRSLPFAAREVAMLHDLCKQISLCPVEPGRRKDDVILHLPRCKIFHFAGHGLTDNADPAESGLLLDDWVTNRLTVATLLGLNLGAQPQQAPPFLAYLSACGTGRTQDNKFVDEGIHLISACQLAGFRHVIGTLWEVSDQSCVDVARITYEGMRDGEMSDESVCSGLHRASREMKHRASREMKKRWLSTLPVVEPETTNRDVGNEREVELLAGNVELRFLEAVTGDDTTDDASYEYDREATLKMKSTIDHLAESLYWVPYVHFG